MKVFNLCPLKKLNEYVIWKEKKRIPNGIVWISLTTVSHPLFKRFMRSLYRSSDVFFVTKNETKTS